MPIRKSWKEAGHATIHDEIAIGCCSECVGGGGSYPAEVLVEEIPSEIHTATAVCNSDIEGISSFGLPRHRRASEGSQRSAGRFEVEIGSSSHHVVEGGKESVKKGRSRGFLKASLKIARRRGCLGKISKQVAIDSTGLEARHVSSYYSKRKKFRMKRYPKWTVVIDTRSYLVLGMVADRGPQADDIEFDEAVLSAHSRQPFKELLADAGYDSEGHHRLVREQLGATTVIPPWRGKQSKYTAKTKYRAEMQREFPRERYGQRWHIESAFSAHKRRIASALRARSYWAQCREIGLRTITHNIMLIAKN
jgi:transposase